MAGICAQLRPYRGHCTCGADRLNQAVIEFLLKRKSPPISQIKEPGPDREQLLEMIRIATRVPDHGLLEPWRFILYQGEARKTVGEFFARRIAELEGPVAEQRIAQEKARFARAPVVVGVVSSPKPHDRIPEWEQFLSGGNAAFSLALAAHAYGFSANWVSNWYSSDAKSREFLGLLPHERAIGFVHIGTVSVAIPDRPRPDPASVLTGFMPPDPPAES
jgi:nitroreductase